MMRAGDQPGEGRDVASGARAWGRGDLLVLGTVLLFGVGARVAVIAVPFQRNGEGTGSYYALIARNYLRLDWSVHRGAMVQSIGTASPPTFYHHHPPLLGLLVAGTYWALGDGEWQARLWPAIFTLGCVGVIYWLLLECRGPPGSRRGWRGDRLAAGTAAALFAAMPMTLFYGGHCDVLNAQLVFFGLLTVGGYLRFCDSPSPGRLGLVALPLGAAGFTDWPAFVLAAVLVGHMVFVCAAGRPRRVLGQAGGKGRESAPGRTGPQCGAYGLLMWAAGLAAVSAGLFLLVYGHVTWASGQRWDWIFAQLARRSLSGEADLSGAYTSGQWWRTVAGHNLNRHTLPVLILAGAWVMGWGWRRGFSGDGQDGPAGLALPARGVRVTRLMLVWGVLHVLVGRQAVYVHDWWWWVLTVGMAMAAGLGAAQVMRLALAAPAREQGRLGGLRAVAVWVVFAVGLAGFTVWSVSRTWPEFFAPEHTHGALQYSVVEMGQAIRLAAEDPDDPVLLAYDDLYEIQLWYYGDRPLKLGVWDMQTLEARLGDGVADLPFGFRQFTARPPTGLVLPVQFLPAAAEFAEQLKREYPYRELEKFLVFDLTGR